jgi:F-type H+-transporting ATPase subunit delta
VKPVKEAKKYAKTLINAVGLEDTPRAMAELSVIEKLMEESREFRSVLVNPGFTEDEKEKALRQVAERAKLSETVTKFIVHIAHIKAVAALPQIIKSATAIYLEKKKRAKATVLSPVELGADYERRLKDSLKGLIDKDVDIEFVMDQSLLGGVLVKVGSTMYDSSVRGQLRLLKDELIKG